MRFFIAGLQADQPDDGLVVIDDFALFIDDKDAVFDGIEERFEETAFTREALDDRLQTFGVEPPDPAQNLVEKIGFLRCHYDLTQVGTALRAVQTPKNNLKTQHFVVAKWHS